MRRDIECRVFDTFNSIRTTVSVREHAMCVEAKIHIHHLNGIENLDANIENGQHSIYQRMLAKCLARPFHIKIVSNYPSHATNTLNETKQSTRSLVEY